MFLLKIESKGDKDKQFKRNNIKNTFYLRKKERFPDSEIKSLFRLGEKLK